jgi:molybdopterin-guanine dinucleotide biosynthesis protein A
MNTTTIHPVVLCGGSGTRLWPLSRKALPKQFAPLVGGKSLLQLTLERLASLNADITCVASEDHRFLVREAADAAHTTGRQILEPVARNTAAAMACAALLANKDDLLLFAPSDHHIPDTALFARTVRNGVEAALSGRIVTFGVVPSFPSTAYGYIEGGEASGDGHSQAVVRFVEKPSAAVAVSLMLHGGYCWNAGIFLVQARTLVAALRAHAPDILLACAWYSGNCAPVAHAWLGRMRRRVPTGKRARCRVGLAFAATGCRAPGWRRSARSRAAACRPACTPGRSRSRALLLRAAVAAHRHPARIDDRPALLGLVADDGGEHAQRDVRRRADADVGHHQVEEHVDAGAHLGHAGQRARRQRRGRGAHADHRAGRPAARRRSAARTQPARSCSAIAASASGWSRS